MERGRETRRRYLKTIGTLGLIGTAGCSSWGSGQDETETTAPKSTTGLSEDVIAPATTGTSPPTTEGTPTMSCEALRTSAPIDIPTVSGQVTTGDFQGEITTATLAESVIHNNGTFKQVRFSPRDDTFPNQNAGGQFLRLTIEDTEFLDFLTQLKELTLVHDETEYEGMSYYSLLYLYDLAEQEEGSIGLPVPAVPTSETEVRFETEDEQATWDVPSELCDHFESMPAFSLENISFVYQCEGEDHLDLTIRNDGDRDGIFRGLHEIEGAYDARKPFSINVPEGTTVRQIVSLGGREYNEGELEVKSINNRFIRWGTK